MAVKSSLIEQVIQIKSAAQASIDCVESDFEIEIEKFDFRAEMENESFVESAHMIFALINSVDTRERVVLEVNYTDSYRSLGSLMINRESDKTHCIEIVSIEAATESRKAYLRGIAEDLTFVSIDLAIEN